MNTIMLHMHKSNYNYYQQNTVHVYQVIFEVLNFYVIPKIEHLRKIFWRTTHMDTEKDVTWQHFCEIDFRDINFHDKHKKHEANKN